MTQNASDPNTLVEVRGLSKQFAGFSAVKGVDLSIQRGHIHALIGPNGAGKSTTFNLITGVLSLTRGQVLFRDQAVAGLRSREIAQLGMSRTFQHVKMIPDMTVLENVALGAYTRGESGVLSSMLGTNKSEEQRFMKEAHHQSALLCQMTAYD